MREWRKLLFRPAVTAETTARQRRDACEDHRRVARRDAQPPEARRISADDLGRHPAGPLPAGSLKSATDRARQGATLSAAFAQCEPYVPARAPDHGADPITMVSPLRPQPAIL